MFDELIADWNKFQLTEEEHDEIDLDVVPDDEMAPQINLALAGKLFTRSSFNFEAIKRLNVHKPLPRGTVMKLTGERIWVDFRIERLLGFCLACGCLGHVLRGCESFDEDVLEMARRRWEVLGQGQAVWERRCWNLLARRR
ncbi:Trehalose phosphorylase [Bienertia sinuspersici]